MSLHRFFVPDLSQSAKLRLDENESRHATKVLRCQPGARVIAFDGKGVESLCRVVSTTKGGVELELLEPLDTDRELPMPLTLLVSLPKGDRQKTLLDMATQLGVARLVPLATKRGVAQPTSSALERLRRAVIESCKQCGRNRLMEVAGPLTLGQVAADATYSMPGVLRLFAHPYNDQGMFATSHQRLPTNPIPSFVAIGPEGGFDDAEASLLRSSGWQRVTLGPRILRVETAAVAMVARIADWIQAAHDPSS